MYILLQSEEVEEQQESIYASTVITQNTDKGSDGLLIVQQIDRGPRVTQVRCENPEFQRSIRTLRQTWVVSLLRTVLHRIVDVLFTESFRSD